MITLTHVIIIYVRYPRLGTAKFFNLVFFKRISDDEMKFKSSFNTVLVGNYTESPIYF